MIKDVEFPRSAIVGGVIRNGEGLIALGGFKVEEGDYIVVCCLPRSIKEVENSNNEVILEQSTHIEMPVDPVPSNTSDGIMMLPVVQSVHLPCTQQEVVLAVNSIISWFPN